MKSPFGFVAWVAYGDGGSPSFAGGQPSALTDPKGNTWTFDYDLQSFGGQAYAVSYAYDVVGNRTAMKTPWGGFTYTYDALNRLTGLVNPQGVTVNFKYDAAGRRVKKSVFKNAPALLAETDYAYDAAGQLLSITNKAGGKVVAFNNYEYDLSGNRVLKKDQDGVTRYGYDKSNRLITVVPVPAYIPGEEAFIYDKNGNRRFDKGAKDYKYDAANRLQANTVYTYTHEANGNLTSRTHKASTTTVTYAYSLEQQLAEVLTPEHRLQYKYDPLGRRTSRTVDGTAANYVYDGQDIIAELDAAGNLINTYTNGPGIDEPLIMSKPDGKNYYYHSDALGSITTITDESGALVEAYSYKAYGYPTLKDAQGQSLERSSIGNLRLFTAREYEPETGDYNYRARYYDPARGVFTQEDPIGLNGGDSNLYSYVGNNPVINRDPTGLFVDTLLDAYFISEDIRDISESLKCGDKKTLSIGIVALGLDLTGAALPGLTGLGKGFKLGFTKHGIERVIERGISPQSIIDTLRSPLKVGPILAKSGRQEQKIVERSAVIVINPETGKVITAWPTSSSQLSKLRK